MLHPDAAKQIPEWKARKLAQWERIAGSIPGLQFVRFGEQQTTHMLTCSTEAFYESVLFGRLPTVERRPARGVREARMIVAEPLIDLTDEEIDELLSRWASGRSALELSFVPSVWGRDGRERKA